MMCSYDSYVNTCVYIYNMYIHLNIYLCLNFMDSFCLTSFHSSKENPSKKRVNRYCNRQAYCNHIDMQSGSKLIILRILPSHLEKTGILKKKGYINEKKKTVPECVFFLNPRFTARENPPRTGRINGGPGRRCWDRSAAAARRSQRHCHFDTPPARPPGLGDVGRREWRGFETGGFVLEFQGIIRNPWCWKKSTRRQGVWSMSDIGYIYLLLGIVH